MDDIPVCSRVVAYEVGFGGKQTLIEGTLLSDGQVQTDDGRHHQVAVSTIQLLPEKTLTSFDQDELRVIQDHFQTIPPWLRQEFVNALVYDLGPERGKEFLVKIKLFGDMPSDDETPQG